MNRNEKLQTVQEIQDLLQKLWGECTDLTASQEVFINDAQRIMENLVANL